MKNYRFSEPGPALEFVCPQTIARLVWQDGALQIALSYGGAYGMGEKYDCLNQKGLTAVNTVQEKFCFQQDKTYCSAPFFWTDTGFGLYVDTCEQTEFIFAAERITVKMPPAQVCLFAGSPQQILREYMGLFGAAVLPPRWAFGSWISANRWNTQAMAEEQIEKLRRYDFPASVLVLEAWSDEATFYLWNGARYTPHPDGAALGRGDLSYEGSPWPDPEGMIRRLHEAGLHLLLWQVPVYKKQGGDEKPNPQNELDRADAVRRALCVCCADGTPYTIPVGHWFAGSMIPDFTNPAAAASWFDKRRYLLEQGVDGFKTDGGEFIYSDAVRFADGSGGAQGRNRYARDYTENYHAFIGSDRVLFSRAGYAGQHRVPLHWAGDQQSQNSELRAVLTAGLSAAATGILFWGFDIGGFAGPLPTPDLYRRATQMACFCPVMQWHSEPDGGQFRALLPGAEGNNERSPWNMADAYGIPEFVSEMRFWHWLRVNLGPYLWHTARQCAAESRPLMRPLVFDWPQDPCAANCDDEYLFGDSLLVAPLLEENAVGRDVYLPAGEWIGLFDRRAVRGAQVVHCAANGRLPVFVRSGFGVALDLDAGQMLGAPVRHRAAEPHLHFLLAGAHGRAAYADGADNDFAVDWEDGHAQLRGQVGGTVVFTFI